MTSPDPADLVDHRLVVSVGAAVRAGRRRLGLSVQSLAEHAGVSLGLVSQLERGIGNPSLQSIQRVAAALGVPVGHLLDGPSEEVAVVPADHRYVLAGVGTEDEPQPVRELLTPRGHTMLQMIRTTLPVGFTNEGRPFRHLATESVLVERGRLLVVHGTREFTLGTGDTVTYTCSTPHWWANAHDAETVVLGAITPFER